MYLHIGRDTMIAYSAIIGLFPLRILNYAPEFRHLVHSWRLSGRVIGDWEDVKTVVLHNARIFLSSISPMTLYRRAERDGFEFE